MATRAHNAIDIWRLPILQFEQESVGTYLSHIPLSKDSQRPLIIRRIIQLRSIVHNIVPSIRKHLKVVLVHIRLATKLRAAEVLGATTKEHIRSVPLCPRIIHHPVDERVDDRTVLTTVTGVGSQRSGSCVGDVSRGDNAHVAAVHSVEDLGDCLDLWVVEGVLRSVAVDSKGVDGRLVASIERSSGVGRVGDEGIDRMGHLMSKHGELVHGHGRLVFAIDRLVADQSSRSDHVRRHAVSNEEQNVLGLADLLDIPDMPVRDCAGAIVVESRHVVAGLIESNASPRLRSHVHDRGRISVLSEQIPASLSTPNLEPYRLNLSNLTHNN